MTKNIKNRSLLFGSVALALLFVFSVQTAQAQGFNHSSGPQSGPSKVSNNWGHYEKSPNFGSSNRLGYSHQNNKTPQHTASYHANNRPQSAPSHHPQMNHVSKHPTPSHHCPAPVVVVGQQRPSLLERIVDIFR